MKASSISIARNIFSLCLLVVFTDLSIAQVYPNITLFEGDIVPRYGPIAHAYGKAIADDLVKKGIMELPDEEYLSIHGSAPGLDLWRNDWHWDTELFHIPVYFTPGAYTEEELKTVKRGIRRLQKMTGAIKFDWIDQTFSDGTPFLHVGKFGLDICASYLGMDKTFATLSDGQFVWIGKSCLAKEGLIHHTMMHALGFYHEHSRPDRDKYVTVYFNSIIKGEEINFQIRPEINSLGSPYDYESVMHYGEYEYSSNGGKTIDAFGNAIGQREKASLLDKIQVRLMYQCRSGSRTYPEHMATKCNGSDCKCGFNKPGCRRKLVNYDSLCKGNLVCKENRCRYP